MSSEYAEYLKTPIWREISGVRLVYDDFECVMCGDHAEVVHHRRYPKILGTETIKDLVSLCHRCHHRHHFPPSVEEIREEFKNSKKNWKCPVCDTAFRVYRRTFNSGMAAGIVRFANLTQDENGWVKVSRHSLGRELALYLHHAEYSKWQHWGLLESGKQARWRLTELGREFIAGEVLIPRFIIDRGGVVLSSSEEMIDIKQALNERFVYEEMTDGNVSSDT